MAKCNRCKQRLSVWAMDGSLKYKTCKRCAQETLLEGVAARAATAAAASNHAAANVPPPPEPPSRLFKADGDAVWKALHNYTASAGHGVSTSDLSAGRVVFTTSMSAFSPGEGYDVTVRADGESIRMTIRGLKKNAFYSLQPGRIAKIAKQLFDAVAAEVQEVQTPPWPQVKPPPWPQPAPG